MNSLLKIVKQNRMSQPIGNLDEMTKRQQILREAGFTSEANRINRMINLIERSKKWILIKRPLFRTSDKYFGSYSSIPRVCLKEKKMGLFSRLPLKLVPLKWLCEFDISEFQAEIPTNILETIVEHKQEFTRRTEYGNKTEIKVWTILDNDELSQYSRLIDPIVVGYWSKPEWASYCAYITMWGADVEEINKFLSDSIASLKH